MIIGEKLAEISLKIGAIRLSSEKPFKWASGYYMPIYNDNRMLLSKYSYRKIVTEGFKVLIDKHNIGYDIVAGTNSAGIAPATSLADSVGKPLAIIYSGAAYLFTVMFRNGLLRTIDHPSHRDFNVVASTAPFSIIPGVMLANEKKLPFVYVRQSKKKHGLEQQIEGVLNKDDDVVLINFGEKKTYKDVKVLVENGGKVVNVLNIYFEFNPKSVSGARILHIEDLISTGGSSIEEMNMYKAAGASADCCFSIFNYGFDETMNRFKKDNKVVDSILYYDVLLNIAKKMDYINIDQLKMLQEWREDPFGWGEKHGFPREE